MSPEQIQPNTCCCLDSDLNRSRLSSEVDTLRVKGQSVLRKRLGCKL